MLVDTHIMTFKQFREEQLTQQNKVLSCDQLYTVNLSSDQMWECYINGFQTEEIKQEHNCNCCRSWIAPEL